MEDIKTEPNRGEYFEHDQIDVKLEGEVEIKNEIDFKYNDGECFEHDQYNVKFEDEVKVTHYLKTLSLIDTFPFLGQRSVQ